MNENNSSIKPPTIYIVVCIVLLFNLYLFSGNAKQILGTLSDISNGRVLFSINEIPLVIDYFYVSITGFLTLLIVFMQYNSIQRDKDDSRKRNLIFEADMEIKMHSLRLKSNRYYRSLRVDSNEGYNWIEDVKNEKEKLKLETVTKMIKKYEKHLESSEELYKESVEISKLLKYNISNKMNAFECEIKNKLLDLSININEILIELENIDLDDFAKNHNGQSCLEDLNNLISSCLENMQAVSDSIDCTYCELD